MSYHIRCTCCGFEETLASEAEAFQKGWDTPEHFVGLPPFCPLCPSSPFVIAAHRLGKGEAYVSALVYQAAIEQTRKEHQVMHDQWAREGRPEQFDMAAELKLRGITKTAEEVKAEVRAIIAKTKEEGEGEEEE